MPVKIKPGEAVPILDRLDAFRRRIPDGEGYTLSELEPLLGYRRYQLSVVLHRAGWLLPGRTFLLVNPRTLKRHAPKNQPKRKAG